EGGQAGSCLVEQRVDGGLDVFTPDLFEGDVVVAEIEQRIVGGVGHVGCSRGAARLLRGSSPPYLRSSRHMRNACPKASRRRPGVLDLLSQAGERIARRRSPCTRDSKARVPFQIEN